MIFCERERIDNDAVFGALYLVHLVCLLLDGHVLVNDTDAPSRAMAIASVLL